MFHPPNFIVTYKFLKTTDRNQKPNPNLHHVSYHQQLSTVADVYVNDNKDPIHAVALLNSHKKFVQVFVGGWSSCCVG